MHNRRGASSSFVALPIICVMGFVLRTIRFGVRRQGIPSDAVFRRRFVGDCLVQGIFGVSYKVGKRYTAGGSLRGLSNSLSLTRLCERLLVGRSPFMLL